MQDSQYKFLTHISSLPVVHDLGDEMQKYPLAVKAQGAIKQVSITALKMAGPIEPYLEKADGYADAGLVNLENRFPIVKAPTSEVIEKTKQPAVIAKSTVDTYVGAAKDKWNGTVKNGSDVAHQAQVNGEKMLSKEKVDPVLKPVLDKVESILDAYLPQSEKLKNSFDIKKPDSQAERLLQISQGMIDRSKNGVSHTVNYGVDRASTVAGYASWGLHHPLNVPSAAINRAVRLVHDVRNMASERAQQAHSAAQEAIKLAQQAQEKAFKVFDEQSQKAPKQQPQGIITATYKSVLVLQKEARDYAWSYIQPKKDEIKDGMNGVTDFVHTHAHQDHSELSSFIPSDDGSAAGLTLGAEVEISTSRSTEPKLGEPPLMETYLVEPSPVVETYLVEPSPVVELYAGESFADAVKHNL